MDEDFLYRRIMTSAPVPRPSRPPPYEHKHAVPHAAGNGSSRPGWLGGGASSRRNESAIIEDNESIIDNLPRYSPSVAIEGVFTKKHEIENTIKRAEDRHWHTRFVTLNGTALNIYNAKKDWGWGRTRDGPSISPDNPPWIRKGKLEKSYSLLHADAGIAADYKKRRYVIRIRAEEDQFLLCCIELETFVKWLECLFAAIDVAAPIDDRDFPRDMSIPRMQRIRWFRGQSPVRNSPEDETRDIGPGQDEDEAATIPMPTVPPPRRRRSSTPEPLPSTELLTEATETALSREEPQSEPELESEMHHAPGDDPGSIPHITPRIDPPHRLSTSSYPNPAINPHSGKWFPEHNWSSAHDLLYAKLCYSNLLFRSPRKSNYIISKGKQWYVDWGTGRMVRVLPPTYGEIDYFGAWQTVHTENRRI
ncbi:PH domain-like protein [Sarocladium strictum]